MLTILCISKSTVVDFQKSETDFDVLRQAHARLTRPNCRQKLLFLEKYLFEAIVQIVTTKTMFKQRNVYLKILISRRAEFFFYYY